MWNEYDAFGIRYCGSRNANCGIIKDKYIRIPDKNLVFWYSDILHADILIR